MTIFTIPIETRSEANGRDHYRVKAKQTKTQRTMAHLYTKKHNRTPLPVKVMMVRLSPCSLDDDNLASALKAIRDGIADAYGVDDRGPHIQWEVRQEKAKEKGVRVIIEPQTKGESDGNGQ